MSVGRNALSVVGLMVVLTTGVLSAQSIPVPNGSFESPSVPLQEIARPGADDWTTTGGVHDGVFPNLPQDIMFGGVIARRIINADGLQLAYIDAIADPNNPDPTKQVSSSFYQTLGASYQAGSSYTLSVGVAISSVQPPDPTAKVRLELFYTDNGVQKPVATTLVTNDAATNLQNNALTYFTLQTPGVLASDAWAGQPIGILLSTADNTPTTGGTFDLDNVTLTAIPEPAAGLLAMLLPIAALYHRRRK